MVKRLILLVLITFNFLSESNAQSKQIANFTGIWESIDLEEDTIRLQVIDSSNLHIFFSGEQITAKYKFTSSDTILPIDLVMNLRNREVLIKGLIEFKNDNEFKFQ